MEKDLVGKRAVVTGGSSGIGLAIARLMAERGASVVVSGRSAERGAAAVRELREIGAEAEFVEGDMGDYAASEAVVGAAVSRFGGLDMLVSAGAAGPFGPKLFAEMTPEELESSFSMRFFPRIYPVHAAIPALRESNGSVVLIGTDAARHTTPGEAIIGAVGASIILMTKALAREFSRWNIRVNGLALTLTSDTPSWDRIFAKADFENKVFSKALDRFPAGRAPTADEVAKVAVFLASGDAGQVSGQTVSVNGGLSFGGW